MQQDQFRQKITDVLLSAGLQPYQATTAPARTTIPAGIKLSLLLSRPGWYIDSRQTRRELQIDYRTDADTQPAGTIESYISQCHRALTAAGIRCRYTADRAGIIATDVTEPAEVYRPPAGVLAAPATVDMEAYRLTLLVDLAIELSAATGQHAARYEYLTAEGRRQFRDRVRAILYAPAEQLHMWRQRGIGQ